MSARGEEAYVAEAPQVIMFSSPGHTHPPYEVMLQSGLETGGLGTRKLTIVSPRSLCSRSVCTHWSRSVHATQRS